MGPMTTNAADGLPSGHWIHKAVAKEKDRMQKRAAGPAAGAKTTAKVVASAKAPLGAAAAADPVLSGSPAMAAGPLGMKGAKPPAMGKNYGF